VTEKELYTHPGWQCCTFEGHEPMGGRRHGSLVSHGLNAKIMAIRRKALRYRIHEQNASRDAIRLYLNGFRMIRKHLRLVAAETLDIIRKNYYIFLYNYFRPTIVHWLIKRSPKIFEGGHSTKNKRNVILVLRSMVTAPRLGWLFVRGTMTAAIKRMLRRFERLN
jgi:hypothetical protein